MKLEVPDNAREAFQFLALGIGSLLLVRIGYIAAEHCFAPSDEDALGQLLVPFKRGYLIGDPHTLVPERSALAGRICRAALLGVLGGAATGLIAFVFQRALRIHSRAPWLSARIGFILFTLTGVWSAIAWPPRSMQLDAQGVHLMVRPELLGLALPCPIEQFDLPFAGSIVVGALDANIDEATVEFKSSGKMIAIEPVGSDARMDSLCSWLTAASSGAH
ncbi:MAG: hypothetical protein IPL52_06850 [Flavobacteriales bacterium]|nr:hypothetical protein [Flavobacteriales bacterium]